MEFFVLVLSYIQVSCSGYVNFGHNISAKFAEVFVACFFLSILGTEDPLPEPSF